MNVIPESIQIRRMELKYCERCGSIWLRRCGSEQTQCAPCARTEDAILNGDAAPFLQLWSRFRAEVEA